MCSLVAHVEDGRLVRIQGDPSQPFTAGFACAKVNREPELVYSPERIAQPLRRSGFKGAGAFAPVTWDEALDEIVEHGLSYGSYGGLSIPPGATAVFEVTLAIGYKWQGNTLPDEIKADFADNNLHYYVGCPLVVLEFLTAPPAMA